MNLSDRAHAALTEAAVRQAWRIGSSASHSPTAPLESGPPLGWSGRRVSWVRDEGHQLKTFVALCARPRQGAPADPSATGGLAARAAAAGVPRARSLLSADSLQARLDAAVRDHRIAPSKPQPKATAKALMQRAASWLGLISSEGRLPTGLLQSMVDSGLPLRQEMLEQMRTLADWIRDTDIPVEPLERARQGASLMIELDKLSRLLKAAQGLVSAGQGWQAGFSTEVLAEMEEGLHGALLSVAQAVAQVSPSSCAASEVGRWQQVITIDRLDR